MKRKRRRSRARAVQAPASLPLSPNRVISVSLRPGEDVLWTWTTGADGTRFVSGYTITPAANNTKR